MIPIGDLTSPPPGWTPTNGAAASGVLGATASVDSTMLDAQAGDDDLAYAPATGNGAGAPVGSTSTAEASSSTFLGNGASQDQGGGSALDLALAELSDELSLAGLSDWIA
jgi:hypothetical protein